MTSVSAGHIILTLTQPVGSGRPQRESNPGPAHQESRALPTELPRPPHKIAKQYQTIDTAKATKAKQQQKQEENKATARAKITTLTKSAGAAAAAAHHH